jgi:hypothetical protein
VTVPAVIELLEGPRFCTLAPERSCERDGVPDLTVDEPPGVLVEAPEGC